MGHLAGPVVAPWKGLPGCRRGVPYPEAMATTVSYKHYGGSGADEVGNVFVTDEDFAASIAYLARRLDENTGPENWLNTLFYDPCESGQTCVTQGGVTYGPDGPPYIDQLEGQVIGEAGDKEALSVGIDKESLFVTRCR